MQGITGILNMNESGNLVFQVTRPNHMPLVTVTYFDKAKFRKIEMKNLKVDSVKEYNDMKRYVLDTETLKKNAFPLDTEEDPGMVTLYEYFPYVSSYEKHFWKHQQKVKFVSTNVQSAYNNAKVSYTNMYALDCEMCITKNGLEVTKISIIDSSGFSVYNTFVLPSDPIIDYNTQYSGVTEDDLKYVTTTLEDVQAVLLSILGPDNILIGHGLQNDLKALKIIHKTIVDTSVVFPDARGHPYKRSLKSIVKEQLGLTIQNGMHDSVIDAKVCMDLMKKRIAEDSSDYIPSNMSNQINCMPPVLSDRASAVTNQPLLPGRASAATNQPLLSGRASAATNQPLLSGRASAATNQTCVSNKFSKPHDVNWRANQISKMQNDIMADQRRRMEISLSHRLSTTNQQLARRYHQQTHYHQPYGMQYPPPPLPFRRSYHVLPLYVRG